jgi:hypothetical protein
MGIVHEVLDRFARDDCNAAVAVYTANYLRWRVTEKITDDLSDEVEVIKFLNVMNDSNGAHTN